MIDYHSLLVAALQKVLPTHYELTLTSKTKTPCISYQEANNIDDLTGDTVGYSRLSYTVKVWHTDIAEIQKYVLQVDAVLRPLGFKRISTNELADRNSTMIQKILTYEALAYENYYKET
jgi:hypothetical protein